MAQAIHDAAHRRHGQQRQDDGQGNDRVDLRGGGGRSSALATAGNLNNDIGVPLTLFRLNAAHRLAVIELGMNHPGEIAVLAKIAAPTVGVVNNAQREHQEFMATVEAVALENARVIHALADGSVAVFPADDAYASIWRVAATGNRDHRFRADPTNARRRPR